MIIGSAAYIRMYQPPIFVAGLLALCWSKIDDFQPLLFSIVHRIGCPATLPVEVADTYAAVVHQMPVPLVHAARCILFGRIDHFICLGLDALILRYVLRPPAPCLRQAGQNKDQLHAGAALTQTDYGLGGDGIKAQGTPGPVVSDTLLV